MADEIKPTAEPRPIDWDLHCLKCGYNLRGLSGDPVRCPECGSLNPLGEAEIPEELVTRQVRKLETPLALCALATTLGVPPLGLLMFLVAKAGGHDLADVLGFCGLPVMVPVGVWMWGFISFGSACRYRHGWLEGFWAYQYAGCALAVLVMVPLVAAVLLLPADRFRFTRVSEIVAFEILIMLLFGVIFVSIATCRKPINAWVKRRIEPLIREAAVEMLRDKSRRRVSISKRES
jgi:hypothetical protein